MKEFYYRVRYEILYQIQSYRSAINHPTHSLKNATITILTLLLLITELYAVKLIKDSKEYNFTGPVIADSLDFTALGPQVVTATPLEEGDIIASPSGSGFSCTIVSPCSLATAIGSSDPGEVVFLRGGVYSIASSVYFNRNGTEEDNIIYESYPGETAILDGSSHAAGTDVRIRVTGRYNNLRKFEIRNMPMQGLWIGGNHNTINGIYSHHNKLSGVQIFSPYENYPYGAYGSYNTIQNVTANDNSDADLGGPGQDFNQGGNADGISISSGEGNVVINSIAERNSDDGIDVWRSTNSHVSYSIAAENGIDEGNGNGFKAGGASPSDGTIVERSVAYDNRSSGFDANSGLNVTFDYITSWSNDAFGVYGYATTTIENSIAIDNGTNVGGSGTLTNNSWQRGGTPTFVSTDPGSIDFLKPVDDGGFDDIGALATDSAELTPTSTPTPTDEPTPTPTITTAPTEEPSLTPTEEPTPTISLSSDGSTPTPIVINQGGYEDSASVNSYCGLDKPSSAPNLYQIDTSLNTASLYFSPAGKPYDRYFVQYGLTSSANQYGAQFELSNVGGAIKFIAGDLAPNTTYYFMVRAGNACAPGEWSKVIAATTGKEQSVSSSLLDKISPINIINKNFRATTVSTLAASLVPVSDPESDIVNEEIEPSITMRPTATPIPTKAVVSFAPIRPIAPAPVKEGFVSRIISFFSSLFGR